ncbi:MAG: ferrous iron transporter B, partial [Caldilineaceae bacterium]|nr:ferrous iron transporter B [Caldilineaceae bacterium]
MSHALAFTHTRPTSTDVPACCAAPAAVAQPAITYDEAIAAELAPLVALLDTLPRSVRPGTRWLAINLLEGAVTAAQVVEAPAVAELATAVAAAQARLAAVYGDDLPIAIADGRYQFAHQVAQQVVSGRSAAPTRSDRSDRVLTHPWLGLVLFAAIMYVTFNLVQAVASPYVDWIDGVFNGPLAQGTAALLAMVGAPAWLTSLVVDGVIPGVGGVLAFVPSLLMLYLALGLLEQSGYLARAAFVMDRFMSVIGLHGKSFVPLILGFGCNVPAIYATRTIESPTARRLTALLVPFMSCTARLPIYVIFGLAFFPHRAGLVIWGLYLLGMVVAALVAAVLTRTMLRSDSAGAMIMELPPYQAPAWRDIGRQAMQRSGS